MSNVDQTLYQQLTQDIGAWSGATGKPGPSAAQVQQWERQYGMSTLQDQLNVEAQNVGYYWNAAGRPATSVSAIQAAAQKDPRWSQLDATGREILLQMYNLQAMGYGGDLGANTPLPAQTVAPGGNLGIGAPAAGMTSSQQDAWAQLQQTLQSYGFSGSDLQALVQFAQQQIIAGNSQQQVILNLEQTPQFQQRFPAIGKLAQQGVAISPAEYISLEQQYAQLEQAAGLPKNFASFDNLIANQVSPSEYADRINKGYLAVSTAPPETIKAMQDYYGVTHGQLAAYFLDPAKAEPILLQQAQAAQIGGASAASGFGQVSQDQAMRLAQQGVSYAQAQQGFQQLSQQSQLFHNLPGQGQRYGFTTDNLLGATFGSDGQTKLQLQIQAEQEKNYFQQGTGVASTQQGLTGAGNVQR